MVDPLRVLPDELALLIFSFLDEPELVAALQTSRSWNRLAQEPSLWASLFRFSTWNPNDVSSNVIVLSPPSKEGAEPDLCTLYKPKTSCGSRHAQGWLVTGSQALPHTRPVYFEVVAKKEGSWWGCQAGVGVVSHAPLVSQPEEHAGNGFFGFRRVYPVLLSENGWGVSLSTSGVLHDGQRLSTEPKETCPDGVRVGVLYDDSQGLGLLSFYLNGRPLLSEPLSGIKGPLHPAAQMCCADLSLVLCCNVSLPKCK
ncbi:hypothetical protein QOT17_004977 [Balamuthia mandrillaris]